MGRDTLTPSRDPLAAWRQPDTNTSTDTDTLALRTSEAPEFPDTP
jgi:hypothetical protein